MTNKMLSDERIKAFLDDLLCCQYGGKEIDKLLTLLQEVDPIIRKDERERIAEWLEYSSEIVTKQEAAKQLKRASEKPKEGDAGTTTLNKIFNEDNK